MIATNPHTLLPPLNCDAMLQQHLAAAMALMATSTGQDEVSAAKAAETRRFLMEIRNRLTDSLRLYEPLQIQRQVHLSLAKERIVIGSNRAGKTLTAAIEIALALRGMHPNAEYPKKNGRCYCVGRDGKHIGEVMYRKLFRGGAFKIIKDLEIGQWRAYRAWTDEHRKHEARPAAPLIPQRYVKHTSWENKGSSIPSKIVLTNGWEIDFFTSLGSPPMGVDLDLVWFDEELPQNWYTEMAARLLDRHGRFLWSATPQSGTHQLFLLDRKAKEQAGRENPGVEAFFMLLDNNPHITEQAKKEFKESLEDDPLEYAVRVEGKFLVNSFKMYPEFNLVTHGVDWFTIPPNWCRYMVVDPGNSFCATLFFAVPPPEMKDECVYQYDELYIKDSNAPLWGVQVEEKTRGQSFEAFIIDENGSRRTESQGINIKLQYVEELKRQGVRSRATGHGFVVTSADRKAGCSRVRSWLHVRQATGKPKYRVLRGTCPNTLREFERFHRKRIKGIVTDDPDHSKWNHAMDCIRYGAMHGMPYRVPVPPKRRKDSLTLALEAKGKRNRKSKNYISMGPGKS